MTTQEPYNQRTLNLQAAEFYKSIRKEKSKWESITDLSPILAEFKHYIAAGDYEKAFYVFESIYGHLHNWSEFLRIIEMGETLLSEKDPFRKLPDIIIMKIKTYMSWCYIMTAQLDKGEKIVLEAKIIGEKLFANGSSNDNEYEFMTHIFNYLIGVYVFAGRAEKVFEIIEEGKEKLKNVNNPLYKASFQLYHGWGLQEMGDAKAWQELYSGIKFFEEIDEAEMESLWLNHKELALFDISKVYADLGQIKASIESFEKSYEIHKKTNDVLFPILVPYYGGYGLRYSYDFCKARKIGDEGVMLAEKYENLFNLEKNSVFMGNLMRDKGVWNIFVNKSEPEEGEEKPYEYQKKAFTFFQAAIDIYQRSAEMANTLGITADVAMLHGKIGNIYCRLGDGDPGLFVLAEENLKKALDLAQSDTTKYGTCLNLGRLYVYEAGKIY
ncbi:MAG: hypothetical protein GY795_43230, partial [Desulfobacterales bacterium]|nr:hypothetical protein [Desulfobacterales bacterium]